MEPYCRGVVLLERHGKRRNTRNKPEYAEYFRSCSARFGYFRVLRRFPASSLISLPQKSHAQICSEAPYETCDSDINDYIDDRVSGDSTRDGRVTRKSAQTRRKGVAPGEFYRGGENLSPPARREPG